jgi:hypothetical protein
VREEKIMVKCTLARAASFTLLAVLVGAGVASAACPGDAPDVVLACFSAAYSNRDVATLEEVLAPDYMWLTVAPPRVEVFRREDSVSGSAEMFRNPEVESVSLEFHDGYRVVQGEEPGTWRIEELRGVLSVKRASVNESAISPLCVTLYVREIAGDAPGYQVYREVFFEGEGCVGK